MVSIVIMTGCKCNTVLYFLAGLSVTLVAPGNSAETSGISIDRYTYLSDIFTGAIWIDVE